MLLGENPTNTKLIIAAGLNGAERSTDGGVTWKQVDMPSGPSATGYDPTGATAYAGVVRGGQALAHRSPDNGATRTVTS